MNDLLGSQKWNFRTGGPPWFLLFIRGLTGWIHALKTLQPSNNQPIDEIESNTKLFIRITENNKEIAYMEFPSRSVIDLEALMPDQALDNIKNSGIVLAPIIQKVIQSQFAAQVLFEAKTSHRVYKVWLA